MEKYRPAIFAQIRRESLHTGPALGEEPAHILVQRILNEGEEALLFLFREIVRGLKSSAPSSSTPSGMIPLHFKVAAQTGKPPRKKKPAGG
ncbi:MAG: hypothetical protein ACE15F_09630 [bacterium]